MRVVADTSPLNYLALIGVFEVLPALFGSVAIPAGVDVELRHIETPQVVRSLIDLAPPWLHVHDVPLGDDLGLAHLDEGERQVILLAKNAGADLVLMDERPGVAAARARGLAVTGTLGVLDRANRRGLVNLPEAVARLKATSFRCRPALLDELLA